MAGQVCFAHQIGQRWQEKLHNERHKWNWGEGRGLGVWFCKVGGGFSTVVQSKPPPPPSHVMSEGYHSVVCSQAPRWKCAKIVKTDAKNAQGLFFPAAAALFARSRASYYLVQAEHKTLLTQCCGSLPSIGWSFLLQRPLKRTVYEWAFLLTF